MAVPSREEIERLFAELPEGKYLWAVYGVDEHYEQAYWFCPLLLTGKTNIESARWQRISDSRVWHTPGRLYFAFKVADHVKEVTREVENEMMETMERLQVEGRIILGGTMKHFKTEMSDDKLIDKVEELWLSDPKKPETVQKMGQLLAMVGPERLKQAMLGDLKKRKLQ